MNFKLILTALAGAAVAIVALETYHRIVPAGGGGVSRDEIQSIVREYIVAHPEVLQESMAELEKRQQVAESEKARTAVKEHSQAIFNSPRQVTVGDRQGDVTLVEFFDYNCGYCKQALGDLNSLMKSDGKLRVVLKEFPVLGPGSVEAAQVAVAVRMQDPTGEKYLAFHQKLLGGRGQADKARALAAAQDVGIDMGRLEHDLTSDEVKASIEESFKLAEQLGLNGTPSYVVGSDVVVGAVGLASLKEKVKAARCGGAATC
jgi:protein-disulfide isomerase